MLEYDAPTKLPRNTSMSRLTSDTRWRCEGRFQFNCHRVRNPLHHLPFQQFSPPLWFNGSIMSLEREHSGTLILFGFLPRKGPCLSALVQSQFFRRNASFLERSPPMLIVPSSLLLYFVKVVSATTFKIIWIVSRRNLHTTSTE